MIGLVHLQNKAYLNCKKKKKKKEKSLNVSIPQLCFNGRCNVAIILHTSHFSTLNLGRNTLILYTLKELLYIKKTFY